MSVQPHANTSEHVPALSVSLSCSDCQIYVWQSGMLMAWGSKPVWGHANATAYVVA